MKKAGKASPLPKGEAAGHAGGPESDTSDQHAEHHGHHGHHGDEASDEASAQPQGSLSAQIGELHCKRDRLQVSASEWTIQEDCFLIRHFGIRKTPIKQIETKYFQLKAKNPDAYTKEGASLDTLRQRFEELQSNSEVSNRAAILQQIESRVCAEEDAADGGKAEVPKLNAAAAATPEDGEDSKEEIDVKVVDLNGRARSKLINRAKAMAGSKVLSTMIQNLPPSDGSVPTPPVITLDANALEFEKGRKYDIVQYSVIERLLKFCEEPDCMQTVIAGAEKQAAKSSELEELLAQTTAGLQTRRDFWLRKARAKAEADAAALRQQNEAEFNHYIRHIRQFFDQRLQGALSEQRKLDVAAAEEIELFFSREELGLREMAGDPKAGRDADDDKRVASARKVAEGIFDKEHTMKLAVASKLLDAPGLDDACRTVVKQDLSRYFGAREWTSDLIAEQYHREVLPTMKALDLAALWELEPPASYLSREHLDHEMRQRRKIAEQEMRCMTNDEMQAVISEPSAWPDLVDAECRNRQEARGSGALNAALAVGQPLALSNYNTTVEVTHPLRKVGVQGVTAVRSGSWGKPYFEVSLDVLNASIGSTVCVGWDLVRSSLHPAPIPGMTPGDELTSSRSSWGISLQSDGLVHLQGRSEVVASTFGENSIVGCGLDLSTHRVSFFVDGKPLDISQGTLKQADLRAVSPYVLVASATAFVAKANSHCRLSFNFTGPFYHDKLVKDGFWEPLAEIALKHK
jgi:hypothetical protein